MLRAILRGLFLRCPNCGYGGIGRGLLQIIETCPNCGVRFEASEGEGVGAMYINFIAAVGIAIAGFFIVNAVTDIEPMVQGTGWLIFAALFMLFFHRHARGLWVGINYVLGGVRRDDERPNAP